MQTQPKTQSAPATQSSAQSIRVVAVKGGDMAGTWEFRKDSIGIGRGANADVKLEGKNISRIHTVIERRADGIFVKDGGSLNGTWVNGLRVTEKQINARDIVHVGGFRLKAFLAATPMTSASRPSSEGARVQLHAVPSEESARANDATEPQIEVIRGKQSDPLQKGEENLFSADAETPDPLPLESELPAFDAHATKPQPKVVEIEFEERTPADDDVVTAKVAPPVVAPVAVAAPVVAPAARVPAPPAPRYLRTPETTTPSAPVPAEARSTKPSAKPAVKTSGKPLTTWVAYAFGAMIASTIGLVVLGHLALIVLALL